MKTVPAAAMRCAILPLAGLPGAIGRAFHQQRFAGRREIESHDSERRTGNHYRGNSESGGNYGFTPFLTLQDGRRRHRGFGVSSQSRSARVGRRGQDWQRS